MLNKLNQSNHPLGAIDGVTLGGFKPQEKSHHRSFGTFSPFVHYSSIISGMILGYSNLHLSQIYLIFASLSDSTIQSTSQAGNITQALD